MGVVPPVEYDALTELPLVRRHGRFPIDNLRASRNAKADPTD
jgi:hypothetical protein